MPSGRCSSCTHARHGRRGAQRRPRGAPLACGPRDAAAVLVSRRRRGCCSRCSCSEGSCALRCRRDPRVPGDLRPLLKRPEPEPEPVPVATLLEQRSDSSRRRPRRTALRSAGAALELVADEVEAGANGAGDHGAFARMVGARARERDRRRHSQPSCGIDSRASRPCSRRFEAIPALGTRALRDPRGGGRAPCARASSSLRCGLVAAAFLSARDLEARSNEFVPGGRSDVLVVDLSKSILDRIARVGGSEPVIRRNPIGLVVFSDVAYEVMPPRTSATGSAPPPLLPPETTSAPGTRGTRPSGRNEDLGGVEARARMLERDKSRPGRSSC